MQQRDGEGGGVSNLRHLPTSLATTVKSQGLSDTMHAIGLSTPLLRTPYPAHGPCLLGCAP